MNKLGVMNDCINKIMNVESVDVLRSFEILLQWCAHTVEVKDVYFKGKTEVYDYLKKNINKQFLNADDRDLLGELYYSLKLNGNMPQLVSYYDAERLAISIKDGFSDNTIKPFCDSRVATGRTLIKIHKCIGNKVLLYGIEKDETIYRICITNMSIYNIPSRIVCIDNEEVTYEINDEVWDRASSWNPKPLTKSV